MTSEDICLLFIILFLCLFPFCLNFFHEALLLLRCLIDLVYSISKSSTKARAKALFSMLCWRRDNKLCFVVLLTKNKKKVNSLLFLSTLRGWIFLWALSQKLITLTIFAKSLRKIDKYLPFAKRNLHENSFTHLRDFLTFVLFVFIEK